MLINYSLCICCNITEFLAFTVRLQVSNCKWKGIFFMKAHSKDCMLWNCEDCLSLVCFSCLICSHKLIVHFSIIRFNYRSESLVLENDGPFPDISLAIHFLNDELKNKIQPSNAQVLTGENHSRFSTWKASTEYFLEWVVILISLGLSQFEKDFTKHSICFLNIV